MRTRPALAPPRSARRTGSGAPRRHHGPDLQRHRPDEDQGAELEAAARAGERRFGRRRRPGPRRAGRDRDASFKLNEIDAPALPTSAVFPRTRLTLLVAALLGLGLGIAAALLRENFATKVETAEDLRGRQRPAGVRRDPGRERDPEAALRRGSRTQPRLHVVAEALRDLRTNLLFTDDSIRSVVITSPDGSHGKTTVAFGLAATLSRAGARTILVDCDLRRGRVAELLELPRTPG
jgi:hypothetical protein